jgi:hypothetical protein
MVTRLRLDGTLIAASSAALRHATHPSTLILLLSPQTQDQRNDRFYGILLTDGYEKGWVVQNSISAIMDKIPFG